MERVQYQMTILQYYHYWLMTRCEFVLQELETRSQSVEMELLRLQGTEEQLNNSFEDLAEVILN